MGDVQVLLDLGQQRPETDDLGTKRDAAQKERDEEADASSSYVVCDRFLPST